MNHRQTYQSLVEKYRGGVQCVKKLGAAGLFIQIGIMGAIGGWKHVGLGYYEIAVPILFCVAIYLMVKDFLTTRRIEENMA